MGVAALLLGSGLSGPHPSGDRELLGSALLTAGGLALAVRRRAPLVVLAVAGLSAVGYQAAGFEVLAVSYLVAVYAAVRAGHRSATLALTVALLAVLQLAALVSHNGPAREAVTQARGTLEIAWLIAAFSAGEAVRLAERRADEAEHTREETARRRADEERLRIARELHDSLTHQISVIKVQSEAAVHVARRRGEQVPEALLAIQEAGREASRELRATLEDRRSRAGGWGITSNLAHPDIAPTGLLAARPEVDRARDTAGVRVIRALARSRILVGTVETRAAPGPAGRDFAGRTWRPPVRPQRSRALVGRARRTAPLLPASRGGRGRTRPADLREAHPRLFPGRRGCPARPGIDG